MNSLNHVALIMDGNGRWATNRGRPRFWGHVRGCQIINSIVRAANNVGVKNLTLFAFSSENWSRPKSEIDIMFKLLEKYLSKEREELINQKVNFRVIGRLENLSHHVRKSILKLEDETRNNQGLRLTFCFSYGGRSEIVDACNNAIEKGASKLTEQIISDHLYRPEISDVDLLIRTGGERRISNYLLWQLAYAEIFFIDTFWPDFNEKILLDIFDTYQKIERRFGKVNK